MSAGHLPGLLFRRPPRLTWLDGEGVFFAWIAKTPMEIWRFSLHHAYSILAAEKELPDQFSKFRRTNEP